MYNNNRDKTKVDDVNNVKDDNNKINENKCELTHEIQSLKEEIGILHGKIDGLYSLLQKDVVPSCNKMGGHINFIENVYTTVKTPLQYIMDKSNYLLGSSVSLQDKNKCLPDIKKDSGNNEDR